VVPESCLRGAWFSIPATQRVHRRTHLIKPRAIRTIWKNLRAAIRFAGSLQPEVCIDSGIWSGCRWNTTDTRTSGVAPVATVAARVRLAVTASVDDEGWSEARNGCSHLVVQDIHIVEFVVRPVPILLQVAGVIGTTRVAAHLALALTWLRADHTPQGLVICNVCGEATNLVSNLHVGDDVGELSGLVIVAVGPSQPTPVPGIHVQLCPGHGELLDGVADTFLISHLRLVVTTTEVVRPLVLHVGDQVGQGVRFNHQNHRHPVGKAPDDLRERVDVGRFVLGEAIGTVGSGHLPVEASIRSRSRHVALSSALVFTIVAADFSV